MTTCSDLITGIVDGIIREEGAPADSLNPGNIRSAPWLSRAATVGGFWKPVSRAQGIAGIAHIVALHIAEGDNLHDFFAGNSTYSGYAPAADKNDPVAYTANVAKWANISDVTAPLWTYIEQQPA